jgi:hypothetical protein
MSQTDDSGDKVTPGGDPSPCHATINEQLRLVVIPERCEWQPSPLLYTSSTNPFIRI